jgi:hypothetical protein
MTSSGNNDSPESSIAQDEQVRGANNCMLLGAGVGVLGAGSALIAGAVCPLCVVVSPALIGLGFARRMQLKFKKRQTSTYSPS